MIQATEGAEVTQRAQRRIRKKRSVNLHEISAVLCEDESPNIQQRQVASIVACRCFIFCYDGGIHQPYD